MLKEIPKATKGTGSNQYQKAESAENHEEVKFSKPKAEVIEELGFNRQQVSQFQQMAEHRKSQDRHPDKVTASAYPTGVQGTLRRRYMCTSIIAYFCENINFSDISRRYLEPYNIFSYHPIRKIPPALFLPLPPSHTRNLPV